MKLTKSLFMLCAAGLSLCACNSDDKIQVPEGPGMIEVKIGTPATRASSGDKININGTITITLTHNENQTLTQTVNIIDGNVDPLQQTVKFWNVVKPQKVTASINGGEKDYSAILITSDGTGEGVKGGNLQADPSSIPAYGETETFTLTGTMKPTGGEGPESGYQDGDASKTFQKYAATVQMAIPVARLEVGAISHEAHAAADDNCFFKNLKIKGVYLDNTSKDGYGGSYGVNTSAYSEVASENYNGINEAKLKKTVDAPTDATFAASAFNFYATGGTPKFKVYFSSADFAAGGNDQNREAWAMVERYKKDGSDEYITKFENGKVYQISDITILDEYILGDEENDAVYGVEVTVKEAVWTVQLTSVEWAQ